MRKFSYRKAENAHIRTLKEPKFKVRKWNFDRIIYYLLLLILMIFLVRYIYIRLNLIRANAQITFEKTDVMFADDVRLKKLYVKEGDTVRTGQRLFTYTERQFEAQASNIVSSFKSDREKWVLEYERWKRDLELERISLKTAEATAKRLQTEVDRTTQLVILDVLTKTRLDDLKLKLFEANQQKEASQAKINFISNNIRNIESRLNMSIDSYSNNYGAGGATDISSRYISPVNGVIGRIDYKPNEIVYKERTVFSIHNPDSMLIMAYFDPKVINFIDTGVIVDLVFPEGTRFKGTITHYFISTYQLPEEFQKKYEPTTRSIVAVVMPLNQNMDDIWRNFFKMNVKVVINKYVYYREKRKQLRKLKQKE